MLIAASKNNGTARLRTTKTTLRKGHGNWSLPIASATHVQLCGPGAGFGADLSSFSFTQRRLIIALPRLVAPRVDGAVASRARKRF